MISMDVRGDATFSKWRGRLADYKRELMPAAVRAINRSLTSTRAEGARALQKEYQGVKIAALKAKIRQQRANRGAPVGALVFSGRRFALYQQFGMRAIGRWGVSFNKLPWRIETIAGQQVTPEMLRRAFRQRGRGGRASVFTRLTKERESLTVLVAPGVARAFDERKINVPLAKIARERWQKTFEQDIRFRITKR